MPPPAQYRPASFNVTSGDDDGSGYPSRQESTLLPGEVRTPAVRPTPLLGDWARGDTDLWDAKEEDHSCTPLNSYGRENLWSLPGDETSAGSAPPAHRQQLASFNVTTSETRDDDAARVQTTINEALAAAADHRHLFGQPSVMAPSNQTHFTQSSVSYTNTFTSHVVGTSNHALLPQQPHHVRFTVTSPSSDHNGGAAHDNNNADFLADPMAGASALGSRQNTTELLSKFRSQSEILSDELYFQAKMFPPPPPPNPPAETRRLRAELWYLIARKWDITQQMPPPPRSPLPGMEEEHKLRLQELTRVPYRGDRWLVQSDRWFQWLQENFDYPVENQPVVLSPTFVESLIA